MNITTIILTSLFWLWALPVIVMIILANLYNDNTLTGKDVKEILLWPYYLCKLIGGGKKDKN